MKKTQKTRITRKIPESLIDCEVKGRILGMRKESYKAKQMTIVTVGVDLGKGVLLKVDSTVFEGSPGWRTIKDMLLTKGVKKMPDGWELPLESAVGFNVGVTLHMSDSKSRTPYCKIVSFDRPEKAPASIEELYELIGGLYERIADLSYTKKKLETIYKNLAHFMRHMGFDISCNYELRHPLLLKGIVDLVEGNRPIFNYGVSMTLSKREPGLFVTAETGSEQDRPSTGLMATETGLIAPPVRNL